MLILLIVVLISCKSNKNVIQGKVSYVDDSSRLEVAAEGVNVFLYQSLVVWNDHPESYDKVVMTGPSGYYSFFPLADGPYYVYSEKLDTSGKVMCSVGISANVSGHETKILDLFLH